MFCPSNRPTRRSIGPTGLCARLAQPAAILGQPLFDPFLEPRMHRLLFLATIVAAAKNVGLAATVGTWTQLDLQTLADRVPVVPGSANCCLESFELALGRAHDVLPLPGLEELEVILRDHAAIQGPDALRLAVPRFHRLDDLLQRRRIVPISREHFVAQRQAAARHHQADADLFAVGPMVARVATLGQRIGMGLSLEVRARHVVQQQVVLDGEQLAEPLLEKHFQFRLVRQQFIETAVQTIVVHLVDRHAQQVGQGALPVEMLGDVKFARRLAQPADDQDQGRQPPGNVFLARGQSTLQEFVQPQFLDQFQRHPGPAELPAVLDPHARAVDLDVPRLGRRWRKQFALAIGRLGIGRLLDAEPARLVHQPEVSDRALPRPGLGAIRFDEGPIRFASPVASAEVRSQEHAPMLPAANRPSFHYTPPGTK